VVGFVLAALATAWCAFALDIVVESTLDSNHAIVMFGRTIATTTPTIETFVLVALGMSAAAIATASIQSYRHRSDEIALRADVDRRWEEISTRGAGMEARNELLEWRLVDLQEQIDALIVRRDGLLAEQHGDVEEAKDMVRSTRSRESLRQLRDGVVMLPELDPEGAQPDAPASSKTSPEPGGTGDNVRKFPA
jgi:hypothetical protein